MSKTPTVAITPGVLRWAREDGGLTHDELGRAAGVPGDRARSWEYGEAQPTLAQIRGMADALRRPVAFFLTLEPPTDGVATPPDFRSVTRRPSRELRREVRAAAERRDVYLELAQDEPRTWRHWRDDRPRDAIEVRERLGVSVESIAAAEPNAALRMWVHAVEDQGVLVFQMSGVAVAECRGFAIDDPSLPVIVLNGADAPHARAFTLLHEFAHLLDRTGALCLLDEDRAMEQRCNRFAAQVLMPGDHVRTIVRDQRAGDAVRAVARAFRVSPVAAALRLLDLRIIGQQVVEEAVAQAAEVATRATAKDQSGGPAHHVLKQRNLGDRYLGAVLEAMHRDMITLLDATYHLDTSVGTLERMEQALARGPS